VVALVRPQQALAIEDLFAPLPSKSGTPAARLLLALDGVEDPQNLGALLRVADGAGVDGIILTERRSAPISPVAVKASAGAAEHLRIARVVNLVRALEELKKQNLWIIGLDERGASDYDQYDFTGNCVLVLGREGAGLHDLVRRTCDHLLRIPMAGGVSSLNVSTAGAVVLYEAARQRRNAALRAQSPVGLNAGGVSKKKQKGLGSWCFPLPGRWQVLPLPRLWGFSLAPHNPSLVHLRPRLPLPNRNSSQANPTSPAVRSSLNVP